MKDISSAIKVFKKALIKIAKDVKKKPDMSEGSVYKVFTDSGFFDILGYKTTGIDIKVQERKVEIGKIPDFEFSDD